MKMRDLRITLEEDSDSNIVSASLEEQCGKVWNVVNFFGGILSDDQLVALANFSLAFGIDQVYI